MKRAFYSQKGLLNSRVRPLVEPVGRESSLFAFDAYEYVDLLNSSDWQKCPRPNWTAGCHPDLIGHAGEAMAIPEMPGVFSNARGFPVEMAQSIVEGCHCVYELGPVMPAMRLDG